MGFVRSARSGQTLRTSGHDQPRLVAALAQTLSTHLRCNIAPDQRAHEERGLLRTCCNGSPHGCAHLRDESRRVGVLTVVQGAHRLQVDDVGAAAPHAGRRRRHAALRRLEPERHRRVACVPLRRVACVPLEVPCAAGMGARWASWTRRRQSTAPPRLWSAASASSVPPSPATVQMDAHSTSALAIVRSLLQAPQARAAATPPLAMSTSPMSSSGSSRSVVGSTSMLSTTSMLSMRSAR